MKPRQEAIFLGNKYYFTGKPCIRGHIAKRFVITKKCTICNLILANEYRAKNPESIKIISRKSSIKWQKQHPAAANARTARRRSSKLQRTPKWLTAEQHQQIKDIYKMAKELETVFLWKQHIDHIIPLQGKSVSGFHHPDNLQILSAKINAEKHNSYEVV